MSCFQHVGQESVMRVFIGKVRETYFGNSRLGKRIVAYFFKLRAFFEGYGRKFIALLENIGSYRFNRRGQRYAGEFRVFAEGVYCSRAA